MLSDWLNVDTKNTDPDYWNNILKEGGLWDIYPQDTSNTNNTWTNNNIKNILNINQLEIIINIEEKKITLFDWKNRIWEIYSWIYYTWDIKIDTVYI